MARTLISALALLVALAPMGAHAQVVMAMREDWRPTFANAVSWTHWGVVDDMGGTLNAATPTDNTNALNSIPSGSVVKADCPHGGAVHFAGSWTPPDDIKVAWDANCFLSSSIVTPGVYPILTPFDVTGPRHRIEFRGLNFRCETLVASVRVFALWINDFVNSDFKIRNCAGLGFFRGSNNLITVFDKPETVARAGSPLFRWIATAPNEPSTHGQWGNSEVSYGYGDAGDGRAQACQPTQVAGTWFYGGKAHTNGLYYHDVYTGANNSGSLILVNEVLTLPSGQDYRCENLTFERISGGARWDTIVSAGGASSRTENVIIRGGVYDGRGSEAVQAAIGIGDVIRGPFRLTGSEMGLVRVEDRTVNSPYLQGVEVAGPYPLIEFRGVNVGASQRTQLRAAAVSLSSPQIKWIGGSVALNSTAPYAAFAVGDVGSAAGAIVEGVAVSGVADGQAAFALGNAPGASLTNSRATPKLGATTATGLSISAPACGVTQSGNDFSAMPIPISGVCPP